MGRKRSHLMRHRAALLAIVLIAFALRVYRLAGQSLWYDEGWSVYVAQHRAAEAIPLIAGPGHTPLPSITSPCTRRVGPGGLRPGQGEAEPGEVVNVTLQWRTLKDGLSDYAPRPAPTDPLAPRFSAMR